MKIDKQEFIASLGGPSAVDSMNPEAQADAIEDFMMKRLNEQEVLALALKGLNEPGTGMLDPRASIRPWLRSKRRLKPALTAVAWATCSYRTPAT